MTSGISKADVVHVARLARLNLAPDEVAAHQEQLSRILDLVGAMDDDRLAQMPAMAHTQDLVNVLREDVAVPGLPREMLLRSAPDVEGEFFRIPKILGEPE